MFQSRFLLAGVAALALATAPAAAQAKTSFIRIAGFDAPGTPARYDRVGILEIGAPKAKNVLVLNPGTSASAAYFAPLARALVARAPKWQVWAVERRENLLEDQSMLDRAKAHQATPRQVFDYYLGWIKDSSISPHVQPVPDDQVAFARRWGMDVEIQDLRRVVLRARQRGGKVVVGGHSLGGTMTTAYATWDFQGRAGADGLAGLVFIDGGSSPGAPSATAARRRLDDLAQGSPWLSFGGIPAPLAGIFSSTGALSVELDPNAPSLGQASGLLPANITPPVPVTNAGQYGYALDTQTSPGSLIAAQAHLGHLAATGDPRDWDDGSELTPLKRFADMFSGFGLKGLDGTAWYHPLRLTIDSSAVDDGIANPAQKTLGVHATHGRSLPRSLRIYAFAAALGSTRVLDATRTLARQSHIPRANLTLIDRHTTYAHNDPNSATPARNDFLKGLVRFLAGVAKR